MMMLQSSLTFHLLFLVAASATAFAPVVQQLPRLSSQLHAADGAPQYDKLDGVLDHAEMVAEGSCMLHIKFNNDDNDDDDIKKLDYKPGHVLALEMKDDSGDLNEDAKKNDGWMRGPYTVSRCNGNDSIDILVRTVGKKSQAFADASPGTPVRFGGQFKVPILNGIEKDEVQQVVLLSTGVGVGPCVGAIELALQVQSFPPIALFASYRESNEEAFSEHLEKLASLHPTKLHYTPVITSETGRISASDETMKVVTSSIQKGAGDTHYHLIGNGQMVNEWKEGLAQAGVPSERVTMEQYFNHRADSDDKAIETIASAVTAAASAATVKV